MTTRDELIKLRDQALRGQRHEVAIVSHPTSGERYAVTITPAHDAIIWAAGPMDANDTSAEDVIGNAFSGDMEDDADWLQTAFETAKVWPFATIRDRP
jgi:hypothetical protein